MTPTEELLQGVAEALDIGLNGSTKAENRKVAFVVLLANFGEINGGRVNYVSNADRDDIAAMLGELLSRWEGERQ